MTAEEAFKKIMDSYEDLKRICNDAKENIKRNGSSSLRVFTGSKGKTKKGKDAVTDDYFDSMLEKIEEHYILDVVATFERFVFEQIAAASGGMEKTLITEYPKRLKKKKNAPLSKSVGSFVKTPTEIWSLNRAKSIMQNQISKESFSELEEIISYRNWLSHGKRWNAGNDSTLKFEEICESLLAIINEIK